LEDRSIDRSGGSFAEALREAWLSEIFDPPIFFFFFFLLIADGLERKECFWLCPRTAVIVHPEIIPSDISNWASIRLLILDNPTIKKKKKASTTKSTDSDTLSRERGIRNSTRSRRDPPTHAELARSAFAQTSLY
jgi:hypothetical protein